MSNMVTEGDQTLSGKQTTESNVMSYYEAVYLKFI